MAIQHETHHLSSVPTRIKIDHPPIEFRRADGWNTDGVDSLRHQDAVHHEARRALVSVKEKLLKRSKQKKRSRPLERIRDVLLQRADSAREHLIESNRAPLCGQWRKPPTLTQSDVGGELGFEALAGEMSPFKRFIASHKCM